MSDNYLSDPRANTWAGWKAAFDIFERHHKPISDGYPTSVYFSAAHDILFMPATPRPLSAERGNGGDMVCEWGDEVKADALALEALGFHWSEDCDCWAKFT